MKELEKQQKEYDESADRHYDLYTPGTNPGGGNGKRPFDKILHYISVTYVKVIPVN